MDSQVRELRDCIQDYLRQRGLPLHKPFRCLSPEHEDKHPSMHYNANAQNVHCFACGATYDVFDLAGMDYGIADFAGKVRKVAEIAGLPLPMGFVSQAVRRIPCTVSARGDGNLAPEDRLQDRGEEIARLRKDMDSFCHYLSSRGVTPESCERYGLFEAQGRAYFPIWEEGRCSGWAARATGDAEPRYKNSPGPLGIWNGDLLREDGNGRPLFVTEGVLDAICIEQAGGSAVSLCGSQNTAKLLQACAAAPQCAGSWRFVACGDPDEAGRRMNAGLQQGLAAQGMICHSLSLEEADGDVAALYQKDPVRLAWLLGEAEAAVPVYAGGSAAQGLEDFFSEAARRAVQGAASTGFSSLDRLLCGGLHPGLYVLGAISSLGKTSFILQIAEHVAEHSTPVLFFSLEQSRFELIAKGLSRISARLCGGEFKGAFTARQLLSGEEPGTPVRRQLLQDTRDVYARTAAALYIREGAMDVGVEEIRAAVQEYKACCGAAPVVVIDYLQILRPADLRATDKQNTDRAVVELKRLSREFDIPVLAVSSFNRENYRTQVSMEAFKESGAVEYCSDVLLGMQLRGAGDKDFDANLEKGRDPRRIELVLLKNRNGVPYAKVPMHYYPRYSLFAEGSARPKAGE